MKKKTLLGSTLALALLVSVSAAQGADDCASAQAISGLGAFPFNNIGATIDGPFDCNGQPVRRDVWFDWTAPSTTGYQLRTCNQTSLDTRVAVYEGTTCPPTMLLVCATGGCIDQTILNFTAVSGQHYLVRVGSRAVGEEGSGTFSIATNACLVAPDDGLEDNDTCETALAMSNGITGSLFVSKQDPDWYSFGLADGDMLTVDLTFTHSSGDIDSYLFDTCGGGFVASAISGNDNEQLTYTNNTGACQNLILRVELWTGDTANDCNTYSMSISGTSMCAPSCIPYCSSLPNATGSPANLTCSGDPGSSLELTSTPVPNTTGQFFYGPMMLAGGSSLGDGLRCVGGALTRLLPFVNAGMMMQAPNTASISVNYTAPYASGLTGTQYFQHWFRSGLATGTGSNSSDALEITF